MTRRVLFLLLLLFPTLRASAIEPTALPKFQVQSPTGEWVESAGLVPEPGPARPGLQKWVLVYAPPAGRAWELLVNALEPLGRPDLASRTVVIVGRTSPENLAGALGGLEKLSGLGWYADPTGAARSALPGSAVPVAYGLRGDVIEWDLVGVPGDGAEYGGLLRGWLGR